MENQNKNVLDDDRIGRLLLKLSLPAFFGMFVMTLYNVVDTVFIGHYVGPLGIAGAFHRFPDSNTVHGNRANDRDGKRVTDFKINWCR